MAPRSRLKGKTKVAAVKAAATFHFHPRDSGVGGPLKVARPLHEATSLISSRGLRVESSAFSVWLRPPGFLRLLPRSYAVGNRSDEVEWPHPWIPLLTAFWAAGKGNRIPWGRAGLPPKLLREKRHEFAQRPALND